MTATTHERPGINWPHAILALFIVLVAYIGFRLIVHERLIAAPSGVVKLVLWTAIPVLAAAMMNRGWRGTAHRLGLRQPYGLALLPGLVAGTVMALVLAGAFHRTPTVPAVQVILFAAIAGPFTEELLFRGFLVHQLALAGLRARSAVLLAALMFGALHVPQVASSDLGTIAMEFTITALGGVLFGAVMMLVRGSVIAAFGFHAALNLVWEAFNVSATAIGDGDATLARGAAVAAGLAAAIGLRRYVVEKRVT